ncbi:MAG: DUF1592 domain-containing protein [Vicinamibacterales bacterium]
MRRVWVMAPAAMLWAAAAGWSVPKAAGFAQGPASPVAREAASDRAALAKYCTSCHNERLKTGGLALDTLDPLSVGAASQEWEKVVRKLRVGVMPPQSAPQPDEATRSALIRSLENRLDRAAASRPNPGHPSVHRLNRSEYANAIRDLLALDVDAASLLPADDPLYGFDNIGEALALSPSLLERYGSAAAQIATLAVGDVTDVVPGSTIYRAPADLSQDGHNDGLPLGTSGGFLVRPTLPLDGEYEVKVTLFKTNLGLIRGLEFPRELLVIVDGRQVFSAMVGGKEDFEQMLLNQTRYAEEVEARLHVRVALGAGPHEIGATFRERSDALNTRRIQAFSRTTTDTSETLIGPPHVETVRLAGPFNPNGPGDTPSRRKIFVCRPAGAEGAASAGSAVNEEACARRIVSALARRAYRGNDTPADVDLLLGFYREGRRAGGFDTGIAFAIERLLSGPKFLVRIEEDRRLPAGTVYRVSDLELASRLSFFLWSSIPDEELLTVARSGRLKDPAVLDQQARRMLADARSAALVSNFAGQWLQLRNLRSAFPDSREFPNFDDQLRQGFRRETELLFDSILREDRSVLDLLTADFTFVNERLAKHYGIPNIYGGEFRRVAVTDEARKGLLGHGSILTVTSHADRTSPVVRGKWVLDTLLGSPPPLPPANVPPLKERSVLTRPMTMRERMEEHRSNPVCASCHKVMDPLGFALENFDAVGAWRAREGRAPIDASGLFIDGAPIDGPVALRAAVLRRPENFVTTLTEKLLIYALGRGIDYHDMPTVRSIVRDASPRNYRLSSLVFGIIRSAPFQKRMALEGAEPVATSAARN